MTESRPPTSELRAAWWSAAFLRYRILAFTTGTLLVLLVFVAIPIEYLAGHTGRSR